MQFTTIIISMVSLSISIFIAWMTWIKPFTPKFSIGNIFLVPDINRNLQIGVQFSVFNGGSQIGILNDFMIIIEKTDYKHKSIWFPMHFYDSQQHLENKLLNKSDLFSMKGIFSPFIVNPKSILVKEIMFQTYKSKESISEGEFVFYFFYRDKIKFKLIGTRTEKIGQSAINNLNVGTITGLMPYQYRDNIANENLPN
jgi:hypothetical protein